MSDRPSRCGMCRGPLAATDRTVCATCRPNLPVRKPVADTLAAIDAVLADDRSGA